MENIISNLKNVSKCDVQLKQEMINMDDQCTWSGLACSYLCVIINVDIKFETHGHLTNRLIIVQPPN